MITKQDCEAVTPLDLFSECTEFDYLPDYSTN